MRMWVFAAGFRCQICPFGDKRAMITQLQTEYLSRLNGRHTSRTLKQFKARSQRLAKARIRKTRSLYVAWYRRQYFLATAHGELKVAVHRNEDIFVAISVFAIALGYACATIAAELTYTFFITAFLFSEASGTNMLIIASVAAVTLAVTFAWVLALVLNAMAIAIMQGANRKRVRSVRATIRQGLRLVNRTIASWLLLLAVLALPVVALSVIGIIHFLLFVTTMPEALKIAPYYIIAAIGALLYMLTRYSLVPFVALFEPSLAFKDVFKRSQQLTSRKGKLFILAAYLMLAAILATEYVLSMVVQSLIGLNKDLAFSLAAVATVIYAYGTMTMFYRKRRQARI